MNRCRSLRFRRSREAALDPFQLVVGLRQLVLEPLNLGVLGFEIRRAVASSRRGGGARWASSIRGGRRRRHELQREVTKDVRLETVGKRAGRFCIRIEQRRGHLWRSVMVPRLESDDAPPIRALDRALGAWKARRVLREETISVRITTLRGRRLGLGERFAPVAARSLPCGYDPTAGAADGAGERENSDSPNRCRRHDVECYAASTGVGRGTEVRRVVRVGRAMLKVVPTPGVLSTWIVPL